MANKNEIRPRVLFVDDDAVISHVYRVKLMEAGYAVDIAEDGIVALRVLNAKPPNLVVLDIMMPKFNGLEVLEFIRSRPDLSGVKVVVLSNFYFDGNDRRIVQTKADCVLVKSSCTPGRLIETMSALLAGRETGSPSTAAVVAPAAMPAVAAAPVTVPAATAARSVSAATGAPAVIANPREGFLRSAPKTMADLRQLSDAFIEADDPQTRLTRLVEFYRKLQFVAALAGQAGCTRIALLLNAVEALLLELREKPEHINTSTLQTIVLSLELLATLFAHAEKDASASGFYARALVVDDEPISARAVSSALHRVGFSVVTIHESVVALAKLRKEGFDLVLVDLVMPGFDGMELCERIRALPRYQQTPIIFVTGQLDFLSRTENLPSGFNDVVVKPFLPIDLAVKALTHWLQARLPAGTSPA